VRYAPHIAVAAAGIALAIAGALDALGIGAIYGGVALALLAATVALVTREHHAMTADRPQPSPRLTPPPVGR
jgi:hypothetical protein